MPEVLIVQAEMAALARVTEWIDAAARRWNLPQSTSFAIHLCFEEAISNIVRHGFRQAEAGPAKAVRLVLECGDDAVTATIEDHGVAFDPREIADPVAPKTIEEATIGGLGIHLMRQFAQQLAYERSDGTNRLTLRFDVAVV